MNTKFSFFTNNSSLKKSLLLITIFSLYFIFGELGFKVAVINPNTTAIWIPSGISIAAFLLFGAEVFPAIFGGAFLVNFLTHLPFPAALLIALGNTLEGIIASFLVKKFSNGIYTFDNVLTVFKFTVLAGFVATAISATIGTVVLIGSGYNHWSEFISVWRTWWFGDASGVLIITPLIIVFAIGDSKYFSQRKILEIFAFLVSVMLVGEFLFGGFLPYAFLSIPVLVWIAFRYGRRESMVTLFLFSIIAIINTLHGKGSFVGRFNNINDLLLLEQLFMGTTAVTMMSLAAALLESKRNQARIAQSEYHFRSLIEKSFDAVALINEAGIIMYASASVHRVLGYTVKEFTGRNVFSSLHAGDKERITDKFNELLEVSGRSFTTAFRYKRKNNRYIWMEVTGTNLLHDPAVNAIVANFHDITEEKEIEKRKDEFISMASHELNTPMTSMSIYIQMLKKTAEKKHDTTTLSYLTKVNDQVNRIKNLINDLLDISKIQLGVLVSRKTNFDMNILVKEIADVFSYISKSHKIVILGKAENQVFGDRDRIGQVISNLLSNAVKYSPKGKKILIQIAQNKSSVIVSVKDYGIGIAKENYKNIFTRFYREKGISEKNYPGLGIGLFISSQIIELHQGKMWVTSVKDKGSVFAFSLPIARKSQLYEKKDTVS